jgi:hypothetical protein
MRNQGTVVAGRLFTVPRRSFHNRSLRVRPLCANSRRSELAEQFEVLRPLLHHDAVQAEPTFPALHEKFGVA